MCYISMNREDGLAAAEVVHESEIGEHSEPGQLPCSRCSLLNLQLDAQMDEYYMDEEAGFAETIRY